MKAIYTLVFVGVLSTCVACSAQAPHAEPTENRNSGIEIDSSHATTTYANFSRVTGTPEEMVLEFAFNSSPIEARKEPLSVDQRIILNVYTAKRLAAALNSTIERHEQIFGVIETDAEKRVKRSP